MIPNNIIEFFQYNSQTFSKTQNIATNLSVLEDTFSCVAQDGYCKYYYSYEHANSK